MRTRSLVALAAMTLAVAACGEVDADEDTAPVTPPVAAATTAYREQPLATEPPTTTVAVADESLVSGCVDLVLFKAFAGDPELVDLWDRVGRTEAGLDAYCTDLALSDPGTAQRMAIEIRDINRWIDAANATTASTVRP